MRGGSLNHVILIQEGVETADPNSNEPVTTWRKKCEAFAEPTDRRGREFNDGSQIFARTTTQFRCRFFDLVGVTEKMRVIFDSRTFKIVGIRQDHARHQDTFLDTEEVK